MRGSSGAFRRLDGARPDCPNDSLALDQLSERPEPTGAVPRSQLILSGLSLNRVCARAQMFGELVRGLSVKRDKLARECRHLGKLQACALHGREPYGVADTRKMMTIVSTVVHGQPFASQERAGRALT